MKVGDIVEIRFIDHTSGDSLLEFLVWGRLSKKTRTQLTIQCWSYPDINEVDHNTEGYTIHRKSVLAARRFIPEG